MCVGFDFKFDTCICKPSVGHVTALPSSFALRQKTKPVAVGREASNCHLGRHLQLQKPSIEHTTTSPSLSRHVNNPFHCMAQPTFFNTHQTKVNKKRALSWQKLIRNTRPKKMKNGKRLLSYPVFLNSSIHTCWIIHTTHTYLIQ